MDIHPPSFGQARKLQREQTNAKTSPSITGLYRNDLFNSGATLASSGRILQRVDLEKYLFLGEYCLRKRTVENLK
jgi:hypothetical protein